MPNTIDHIRNSLSEVGAPSSDYDLNPEITLPEGRKLRPAAVLIPLIRKNDAWHVILTMRSSALKHHPGQIAFPGGKQDESDASLTDTALREAMKTMRIKDAATAVSGAMGLPRRQVYQAALKLEDDE